jgi:AraC-like DNA-binding protein
MAGDPFSDILRMADARPVLTGGLRAGADWSLRFRAPLGIKFLALTCGGWLRMDGDVDHHELDAGDVLLFAAGRGFTLRSDPALEPMEAAELFAGRMGTIVSLADDGEIQLIGGHVAVDPTSGWILSSILPPLLHIGSASPEAPALHWLIDRLVQEGFDNKPGNDVAAAQISQLLLVHVLRAHVADAGRLPTGALRAAADPNLSRALRLVHAEPGRTWLLDDLARSAGMSRTVFAERFRAVAGITPMAYIARWRMLLAAQDLRQGGVSVDALAGRLGYASASAFSLAFKRLMGASPRQFVRMGVRNFAPAKDLFIDGAAASRSSCAG